MSNISDSIHVNVEYFDGTEEGDVNHPYYVASCREIVAVTDGQTLDELLHNIRKMIESHLEGADTIAEFNLIPNPRIIITLELPGCAQTA